MTDGNRHPDPESSSEHELTELLQRFARGDQDDFERAWNHLHAELRRLADHALRQEFEPTLDATALVSETWIRLHDGEGRFPAFENRPHFFGSAARAMTRVLIDRARSRRTGRRNHGRRPIPLGEDAVLTRETTEEIEPDTLTALEDALDELDRRHPRAACVTRLRLVAGLPVDSVAKALGITRRTVSSDWRFARAWLAIRLEDEDR